MFCGCPGSAVCLSLNVRTSAVELPLKPTIIQQQCKTCLSDLHITVPAGRQSAQTNQDLTNVASEAVKYVFGIYIATS